MKLITLLGQTCSGKSQMAVDLAKLLGGAVVVNCDSRQVYKALNVGTGKVEGRWENDVFMYQGVPHYLIDYVDPAKSFTLAQYVQDFIDLVNSFGPKPKFVIVTGGTGLYAKAFAEKYDLGVIKPEFVEQFEDLKRDLNKLSLEVLQEKYQILENNQVPPNLQFNTNLETEKLPPNLSVRPLDRGTGKLVKELGELNNSDFHNPRRLIAKIADTIARKNQWGEDLIYPQFDSISNFAIEVDQEELKEKIRIRLTDRVNQGLLNEVKNLQYLGRQRLLDLGLEYRLTQLFLEGEMDENQWLESMYLENIQYAKRQLTWLKKQQVEWVRSVEEIRKLVKT